MSQWMRAKWGKRGKGRWQMKSVKRKHAAILSRTPSIIHELYLALGPAYNTQNATCNSAKYTTTTHSKEDVEDTTLNTHHITNSIQPPITTRQMTYWYTDEMLNRSSLHLISLKCSQTYTTTWDIMNKTWKSCSKPINYLCKNAIPFSAFHSDYNSEHIIHEITYIAIVS